MFLQVYNLAQEWGWGGGRGMGPPMSC